MRSKTYYGLMIAILFVTSFILYACGQRDENSGPGNNQTTINFADMVDGTHRGRFTYGAFIYIVDVVAEGGRITDIVIIQNKDNEPSMRAAAVLEKVVEEQTLQVDAVSGATASSKALLKAAENAIKAAIKK
jgi:uncharacterized protein with FMN-binding domain